MLLDWKEELLKFDREQVEIINSMLIKQTGCSVSEVGKSKLNKHIKEFGISEVIESTQISIDQYHDGTKDSVEKVFSYIPRICSVRAKTLKNPWYYKAKQIVFMLIRRFYNFNESDRIVQIIHETIVDDYSFEFVKQAVYDSTTLNKFKEWMYEYIQE